MAAAGGGIVEEAQKWNGRDRRFLHRALAVPRWSRASIVETVVVRGRTTVGLSIAPPSVDMPFMRRTDMKSARKMKKTVRGDMAMKANPAKTKPGPRGLKDSGGGRKST